MQVITHDLRNIANSVQSVNVLAVRVIYNEDSNVIMTVTRSASQMRGSELFRDNQLFSRYRSMVLSRNSACSKFLNGQKQIKLPEYNMGSWANCCIIKRIQLFTRVCLMWPSQWAWKETEKSEGKISVVRANEAIEDSVWKNEQKLCFKRQLCILFSAETDSMEIESWIHSKERDAI